MSVRPNRAILFHHASMNTSVQSMSHNFATLHPIEMDFENRPTIREGKLMSQEGIISVLNNMVDMKQKNELQILPENIIAIGDDSLVWHVPGKVRPLLFKVGKKTVKMVVPCPSMIFKVVDGSLSIAALKYKRKPHADDMLFHVPLMNTFSDSRVCVGSAECPDNAEIESMSGWESVIFDTLFTHTNHHACLRKSGDKPTSTEQLYAFWKSIKGDKFFPNKQLNTLSDTTLEEWIEQ